MSNSKLNIDAISRLSPTLIPVFFSKTVELINKKSNLRKRDDLDAKAHPQLISIKKSKKTRKLQAKQNKNERRIRRVSASILTPVESLKPFPDNPRIHTDEQIVRLMASIKAYQFINPIAVDENGMILSGHGRFEAAKKLGMKKVPAVTVYGLTEDEKRALLIADNKLSELSSWDNSLLRRQLEELYVRDYNLDLTGFSTPELDTIIFADDLQPFSKDNPDDLKPEDIVDHPTVTRKGDLFLLGRHKIYCGNSLDKSSFMAVMDDEAAEICVTDPPYNVRINGNVCGKGSIKHGEFAMASGELSSLQFLEFLIKVFKLINEFTIKNAVIYSFMDWRHMSEIQGAGERIFGALSQVCVWVKSNGGMGTFYRSRHEFVFIFRKGESGHINNFKLGQNGRYRTNVWEYAGINGAKEAGRKLLELHPTVKPVSMIMDAIRDCSNRGGIVLDPFAGSGTVIVAAERTKRCARAIELDERYVDIAIRRWERISGLEAIHDNSGLTFSQLSNQRNPIGEDQNHE